MEKARHARIPVHLNAVLIGEKTVPKGCKVRNVSNQGLLLQCDADGRIQTFRDGDHVDIHLLFHRPDGTKYQTITAVVRHVDADGIGVEFCQPDAQLVKLIESYRVEESQSIEATITHHRKVTDTSRSASVVTIPSAGNSANTARRQPPETVQGRRRLHPGLLAMAIALVAFTAGYLYTLDLRSRVSELESVIHSQNGELARFRSGSLDRRDTAGGAGQQMIPSIPGGSVSGTEHERDALASPQQAVTGSPRTAGAAAMPGNEETPDTSSAGLTSGYNTGAAMPAEPAALPGQSAASTYAGDQAAVKHGPWVINLLSSPSRSDADRFAEKARNQGIPVEERRVILNEREFFRVQLTGFMTQKLAEESAGPVKERLGLKDVWIFKP